MSDFFPPEILRQILYKLPVESLVRFTCVCKQWRSLITSSHFISTHVSFSQSQPPPPFSRRRLLLLRRFIDFPRTQLFSFHFDSSLNPLDSFINYKNAFPSPFKAKNHLFFRIVGCLHGLLCLSDDIFGMTGIIILWNPLIKRYVLLPQPRFVFNVVGPYMLVLGFGFDCKRNDYKVVRVAYVQGDKQPDVVPPLVEVYSLETGAWREIKATGVEYCICELRWSQCFINGNIHWVAYEAKSLVVYSLILLFDVSEEKFKKMKLPESLVRMCPMNMFIAEIGGLLAVLHYYCRQEEESKGNLCDVWVRKEYGSANSWTKMYSVSVDGGIQWVLGLRANGGLLVSKKNGMLVSYDPSSQECVDLGIQGMEDAFYAQLYTESLVLLDKDNRAASYGGAKETKKKKKKKKNQRSTDSSLQKEEDQSLILVSEEADSSEGTNTRSARSFFDMMKAINVAYQMAKFKRLTSSD